MPKGSLGDHGISVRDMVSARNKVKEDSGVKGYDFIKYNPHLDKARAAGIYKDLTGKPRDFISMVQKDKKGIPGPTHYKTETDIAKGGKFFIPKGN